MRTKRTLALGVLLAILLPGWARTARAAGNHIVTVRNFEFAPSQLFIARGDTVTWRWESGIHTTTSGKSSFSTDSPGAFWDVSISLSNQVFRYVFGNTGTFPFFCRPHELFGMRGRIVVTETGPKSHTVIVKDFQFLPSTLTISVGDSVCWMWQTGFHTTTSGLSSNPADNPGALWDVGMNSLNPKFCFQFTTRGTFPYFCRPHELFGMKGTVLVSDPSTGVGSGGARARFVLGRAQPNPSSGRMSFAVTVDPEEPVRITIHDVAGRRVRLLHDGPAAASVRTFTWDGLDDAGREAASGVYFLRVESGGRVATREVSLVR